jgi:hypothetical protein
MKVSFDLGFGNIYSSAYLIFCCQFLPGHRTVCRCGRYACDLKTTSDQRRSALRTSSTRASSCSKFQHRT